MIKRKFFVILILFLLIPGLSIMAQDKARVKDVKVKAKADQPKDVMDADMEGSNQLVIWSSGDREVALKLAFMYTYNCKKRKWVDNVRLLIWGPSQKLLAEDSELQNYLKKLKDVGVELWACKACADLYKVGKKLEDLGVDVHYTGKELADMQKSGWLVLTF